MKHIIFLAVLMPGIANSQGIMIREKTTNDSTLRTTEKSVWLPDGFLEAKNRTLSAEIESLKIAFENSNLSFNNRLSRAISAISGKLQAQDNAIKECRARKLGLTLGLHQLISGNRARLNYNIGLSYQLSTKLFMEGSFLSGIGAYSDVGAKGFILHRHNELEIGIGGQYRSHGIDDTLEDEKYLAVSAIVRYYFGIAFIETGVAREWQLRRREDSTVRSQMLNQNRVNFGIGISVR